MPYNLNPLYQTVSVRQTRISEGRVFVGKTFGLSPNGIFKNIHLITKIQAIKAGNSCV
jgi:hypothetical protein